jgi:hypothetical protein
MPIRKWIAGMLDLGMCGMMNAVQFKHRLHATSLQELEAYVARCAKLNLSEFYQLPQEQESLDESQTRIKWQSPVATLYSENNTAHADLFPCEQGWQAPTVIMLHALMSASDTGYRLWAKRFNSLGWNACFIHLPYHYSRTPKGFVNGELAISADLIRTAEGLRQGVIELRQLMQFLRGKGSVEFGLWATSYGGWIASLLLLMERDFRFAALMAPIVNIEHAIWKCGAAWSLRKELKRNGITQPLLEQHFHLSSPRHNQPCCPPERITLVSGDHDLIALPEDIQALQNHWRGAKLLTVPQGHFGYQMMPRLFERLKQDGVLGSGELVRDF